MEPIFPSNHILFGRELNTEDSCRQLNFEPKVDLKNYGKHTNNLLNHFWNCWRTEYVGSLREYLKVYHKANSIVRSIGDIANMFVR